MSSRMLQASFMISSRGALVSSTICQQQRNGPHSWEFLSMICLPPLRTIQIEDLVFQDISTSCIGLEML